jgi:hypothetical protein
VEHQVEQVVDEHRNRLDSKLTPALISKPFRPRPRPKTAIISEAAAQAIAAREWAEERGS